MENKKTQWRVAILSSSKQEHHDVFLMNITRYTSAPKCHHFFSCLNIYWEKNKRILKMLTLFPISKKYRKMEFVDDIREHMKTWSLVHWEASIPVSSSHVLNKNGIAPTFSNSGVKWLDRGTAVILFHGLYLRAFAPNYLTLPSAYRHYYFPPDPSFLAFHPSTKCLFPPII